MFKTLHNIRPPEAPSFQGELGWWWMWLVICSLLVIMEKPHLVLLQTGWRVVTRWGKVFASRTGKHGLRCRYFNGALTRFQVLCWGWGFTSEQVSLLDGRWNSHITRSRRNLQVGGPRSSGPVGLNLLLLATILAYWLCEHFDWWIPTLYQLLNIFTLSLCMNILLGGKLGRGWSGNQLKPHFRWWHGLEN